MATEGGAEKGEGHPDRTERVVDQHGAATTDPLSPLHDVGSSGRESVHPVDVEEIDLTIDIVERGAAHLANMAHPVGHPGFGEVGVEGGVIVIAERLVGGDLLGAAVAAGVRVDGNQIDTVGRRSRENDHGPALETADLHNRGAHTETSASIEESAGLIVGHPALDISNPGEYVDEQWAIGHRAEPTGRARREICVASAPRAPGYGDPMPLALEPHDQAMLSGDDGPAVMLAMRVIVRLAETMGAEALLDISGAHIDSCLYHGEAGLDFAQRLAGQGARVQVPATLNVSSLDLLHPELYRGDAHTRDQALALMAAYEEMGCRTTWTCAPYQLDDRPGFGDHIAWAESNAIVFANSVLGARTHRYGDFVDICCAITGRAPAAGLHLDENRQGEVAFDVSAIPGRLLSLDVAYPVIGHHLGRVAGSRLPVIVGLPEATSEDRLKAIGSAAASSGTVGMFHAVGSTPEAPTLDDAVGGRSVPVESISMEDLRNARDRLSTSSSNTLGAVSLGTPHYSVAELGRLVELLDGRRVDPGVHAYTSTGRDVAMEIGLRGWDSILAAAGVQIVTDTCTYITPILGDFEGVAMTDSAKWAYYAPGNMGIDVVFGSLEDCVESAVAGEVRRDHTVWSDA